MALTIIGYKGVTLNPPATSHEEANERVKNNPIAQAYDRKCNEIRADYLAKRLAMRAS